MPKRLLNLHEEATHLRLRRVCEEYGASVFAKVRVADVLPVDDRTPSDERGFALAAHFDFVVADKDHTPLFAVEFDGPSHNDRTQRARDVRKNRICERFEFPLLRINAKYLPLRYRNMDLLRWFVSVWFLQQAFDQAQANGDIPPDEPFDPFFVMGRPGEKDLFPFWLSQPLAVKIRKLWEAGRCKDPIPSSIVARDKHRTTCALAWLPLDEDRYVIVETAMRAQLFPVSEADLLGEVVIFDLFERLISVLDGKMEADSREPVEARIKRFRSMDLLTTSTCGEDLPKDTFRKMQEEAAKNLGPPDRNP